MAGSWQSFHIFQTKIESQIDMNDNSTLVHCCRRRRPPSYLSNCRHMHVDLISIIILLLPLAVGNGWRMEAIKCVFILV